MQFARGFKKDCDSIVASLRAELGVEDSIPIDMDRLGAHLEIPISSIGEYVHTKDLESECVSEIYKKTSAVTWFHRRRRHVLYNERHSAPRHRSNLAHEFAHALLGHPPEVELSREQLRLIEDEAKWLGGVLMLSTTEAHRVVICGLPYQDVIDRHRLSKEMLIYRINVSGAGKRRRNDLGGFRLVPA